MVCNILIQEPTPQDLSFHKLNCIWRETGPGNEGIIELVDSICRDGADTPISPIQKKRLETPKHCSSQPF